MTATTSSSTSSSTLTSTSTTTGTRAFHSSQQHQEQGNNEGSNQHDHNSPILEALHDDCGESDSKHKRNKRSVRTCLRWKSFPHSTVQRLLLDNNNNNNNTVLSFHNVQEAYRILRAVYLQNEWTFDHFSKEPPCKDDTTSTTATQPHSTSSLPTRRTSLWYIGRVSTLIRFVQLVLEVLVRSSTKLSAEENQSNSTNSSSILNVVGGSPRALHELEQMVSTLLHGLSQSIGKGVDQWKQFHRSNGQITTEDSQVDLLHSDVSKNLDIRQVAYFTFGAMLRLNQYAQTRIALVSPLWKGLCHIATKTSSAACSNDLVVESFPLQLLEQAIKSLSQYLSEGERLVLSNSTRFLHSSVPPTSVQQQHGQTKLLSFLIMRIFNLMKLYDTSQNFILSSSPQLEEQQDESNLSLPSMFPCFLRLRGLPTAGAFLLWDCYNNNVTSKTSFFHPYKDVAAKVEQQIIDLIIQKNNSKLSTQAMLNRAIVGCLLVEKVPLSTLQLQQQSTTTTLEERLMGISLEFGRILLLQKILFVAIATKQSWSTAWTTSDVETLLCICEELLYAVLPSCHAVFQCALCTKPSDDNDYDILSSILSPSIQAISLTLLAVETDVLRNSTRTDTNQRAQLHRLYSRWLAPLHPKDRQRKHQHPLTRELVVSVLYVHICRLAQIPCATQEGRGGIEAPLIRLWIKLFFDKRTMTSMRNNLVALILRLLASQIGTLKETTRRILSKELMMQVRNQTTTTKANRPIKRQRTSKDTLMWKEYSFSDLRIITFIVAEIGLHQNCISPSLVKEIKTFCRQQVQDTHVKMESFELASILLASMEGILSSRHGHATGSVSERFQQLTGLELSHFQRIIISWPCKMLHLDTTTSSLKRKKIVWTKKKTTLTVAVFCFLSKVCQHVGPTNGRQDTILEISKLVELCTKNILKHRTQHRTESENSTNYQTIILNETISLLGCLGKVISPSTPKEVPERIQRIYNELLSADSWPTVAHTLSSLVQFGTTLHESHQQILPTCLPKSLLGRFQCRIQGLVWKENQAREVGALKLDAHQASTSTLRNLLGTRKQGKSIFPTPTALTIQPGSLFLQMPTQEGRHALVIFPPGDQSRKDIEHMLPDDEEGPEIKTMQRIVELEGGGAKCLLHS